jgi:hypothetical protein
MWKVDMKVAQRLRLFGLLVLLAAIPAIPIQGGEQATSPLRALFIGNSYTYFHDLPGTIAALANAAREERPLDFQSSTIPGVTLQTHWDEGRARAAVREKKWDFVILQEQSQRPLKNPNLTEKAARKFDEEIDKNGAQTLLYLTWARKDAPETQTQLTSTLQDLSKKLKARIAPVGPAWGRALKERPDFELHGSDGSHPTPAGTYLAACVFYASIYRKSPVGNTHRTVRRTTDGTKFYAPAELSQADALFLQKAAWATVQEFPN